MKSIKKKNIKPFLFNISRYLVSKSKTSFSRFNVLVVYILIVSLGVNYGTYVIDVANKNILVGKYKQKYVHTVSINKFRNELTDEELLLDFDNDGIINIDEFENKTGIYKLDSNSDGISDNCAFQYKDSDIAINYNNIYDDVNLTKKDNKAQIEKVIGADSLYLRSGYDKKTFAIKYDGVAFSGFKKLCNPFRIMNYTGSIEFTNKKIAEYLKKIYYSDNNNERLLIISYDLTNDKYSVIGEAFPSNSVDDTVTFTVPDDNPLCVIKYSINGIDIPKSLKYSIASNRMKNTSFNAAKINKGESYKYILFSADSQVQLSEDEEYLKSIRAPIVDLQILSSGVNLQLQNRMKINSNSIADLSRKDIFMNLITVSNRNVEEVGEIKGEDILSQIQKTGDFSKVKTSSNGYLEDHTTDFDYSEHSFSLNNFSTETNKQGVGFAMADIVSNYFNYQTLPETTTTEEVLNKLETQKLSAYNVNDVSVMQMLDEHNSNILASTFLTKKNKHANNKTCLNNVIKEIDNNKTVVAYMNNGNKSTAVVVYRITRDAIDPLKYNFYVYDPNYPNGYISLYDDSTGETKYVRADNCIKVQLQPYASINTQDNAISVSYKMTFEYGNFLDYYFGNSNRFHNGLLYSNGDICFKTPVDISKDSYTAFIN